MTAGSDAPRTLAPLGIPDRWTLVLLALVAGIAALVADVPAVAVLWIVPVVAGAILYLLANPGAWVAWFLALGLLTPPLPFEIGGMELPLHPAMVVLAAALFVLWVRLPELRIERNALTLASAGLLAATLISLPWAFYYSGAAIGAQSAMRWVLLLSGFLLLAWIAYGPVAPTHMLRLILAAALLTSIFAIVDFLFQLPRTVRFSDQYIYGGGVPLRRAQSVFYDASALGNFCAMMLTLMLALGRRARIALRIPAWLLWISAPSLAVALVLSFSRGSLVNLILAVAVLAWMRRSTLASWRTIAAAVALVVVIAGAALLVAPDFVAPYTSRLEYSVVEFFARPNEVLSKRVDTWTDLAAFIADNPMQVALGIGYKSLPYTDYFSRSFVADNMYLSLLIETGVPGLAALLIFSSALLVTAWRMSRRGEAPQPGDMSQAGDAHAGDAVAGLGRFLFAFWIGNMAQMLSGDILTYWRVTPVYLAILGLALRQARRA